MSTIRAVGVVVVFAALSGVTLLGWSHGGADDANGRFLAFISTDKPIYHAGDRVFIRAAILDANDHHPFLGEAAPAALMRVTGPKGEVLSGGYARVQDGVVGYAWDVPADASGGQYKITANFPYLGFPPAERAFEVRAYRAPRLKGEIVFLRDGYGPGDVVKASLHVERAEGGIPAGAAVAASAIVDGEAVYQGTTTIDAAGNCWVQWKLPDAIATGDGTLSLAITDGGVVEPIAKTIPILLKTMDIGFYPEGGDLIAGLANRVYLEARTASKKPADIVGQIVDSHGQVVADVRTEHEGRGRFTFTPRAGEAYSLKLSEPAGIEKLFQLPQVTSDSVELTASQDVTGKDSPVKLQCAATTAGNYTVTLSKHGQTLSSQELNLEAGKPVSIELPAPAWADGVLVATVRDGANKALAERLVFREPDHELHVNVVADKQTYVPGDQANLTITTTDDAGNPVAATVGLSVSDASVLDMPERRERAPRLREMVLLESDVRELADAQAYFDAADPKAALAVDLLLGTQGWRRFATEDEAKFLAEYGDIARRVLADRRPVSGYRLSELGGGFGGGEVRALAAEDMAVPQVAVMNQLADRLGAVAAEVQKAPPEFELVEAKDIRGMPMADGSGGTDVRIYAHDPHPDDESGQRNDFTETVYWTAALTTSADTGTARVSFRLNDSVSSFRVSADGFDQNGALGEGTATVRSVKPFYVEPKLPLEVSAGDLIQLPIAAVNDTGSQLPVRLTIQADPSLGVESIEPFILGAEGRDRQISTITVGATAGLFKVDIKATAGSFADEVARELSVKPVGFPIDVSRGGMLEANTRVVHTIEIPASVVPGSVVAHVALYPTPVGNLTDALRGLMQEPYGCFEQTSSTTYPLVMADQYFLSHTNVDPQLIAQSNALLDQGYQRLIGFECRNKGYEWFGEDPGHECLSAYGLLEFTDMSEVRSVDQGMLQDTRNWLLAHRDGKGGFTHERRALHTWITDPDCANGYCTWALLETGQKGLEKEVEWIKNAAATDPNSYVKALAANALYLAGDDAGARQMMDELAGRQENDGHVSGATTSIVGSEGESLDIETTSLAALAWMRESEYAANSAKAIEYLAGVCKDGRYGSTQSTVLALRTIVAFDKARAHPTLAGSAQVMVDANAVGQAVAFTPDSQGTIALPDISDRLTPGKHDIELRMTDGSTMPYALDVAYHSITPASSDQCKVNLAVALKDTQLAEGNVTEALVTVTNRTSAPIPTPIAIVGLPGGLEVRYEQLKELVKAGRIAAYEVRGREVILYWRDMRANERVEIPLSLTAAVPGQYTGPASRAYLYYADENKDWIEGLKVTIAPK